MRRCPIDFPMPWSIEPRCRRASGPTLSIEFERGAGSASGSRYVPGGGVCPPSFSKTYPEAETTPFSAFKSTPSQAVGQGIGQPDSQTPASTNAAKRRERMARRLLSWAGRPGKLMIGQSLLDCSKKRPCHGVATRRSSDRASSRRPPCSALGARGVWPRRATCPTAAFQMPGYGRSIFRVDPPRAC